MTTPNLASFYQYRIEANGTPGPILNSLPSPQWSFVSQCIEDRGGLARLYRRLVTDADIMPGITDPAGYVVMGNRVACPWEVFAEVEVR